MKSIIFMSLDLQFVLKSNRVIYDKCEKQTTSPNNIQILISDLFGIDEQEGHLMTYLWLYENGMDFINRNWNHTNSFLDTIGHHTGNYTIGPDAIANSYDSIVVSSSTRAVHSNGRAWDIIID